MKIENEVFLLKMVSAINTYEEKVNAVKKITSNKEIIKAMALFYSKDADKAISDNLKILLDSNANSQHLEDLVNVVNDLFKRYYEIYYQR